MSTYNWMATIKVSEPGLYFMWRTDDVIVSERVPVVLVYEGPHGDFWMDFDDNQDGPFRTPTLQRVTNLDNEVRLLGPIEPIGGD